jgi:uncharacterized protein (DUF3084 family)
MWRLNPEDLRLIKRNLFSKRRANDRKAQQVMGQRSCEHIQRLKNRIKALSQDDAKSDAILVAMEQRNSDLQAELTWLQSTLRGTVQASNPPQPFHRRSEHKST